jgi:hypothetical protein
LQIDFASISSLLFDGKTSEILVEVGSRQDIKARGKEKHMPHSRVFKLAVLGGRYAWRDFGFVAFYLPGCTVLAARYI